MDEILKHLPYAPPFLFVDELVEISEEGVTGNFTFSENLFFYKGHFRDHPITPGVILTECMAQIGLVSLGIYLLRDQSLSSTGIALTHTDVEFFLPVMPGEQVRVISERIYFRFHKLKCRIRMENAAGKIVCRGILSGMIRNNE